MATSRSHILRCCFHWDLSVLVLLIMSCWLPCSETAAVALTQYTMDQRSDCISAGFLDIPRGQITKVVAPSTDTNTATQVLSCRLQFSVQTEGDTLRLTLEPGSYFGDCDVSLELQMTNSNTDKIIRGCKSGTEVVPVLEAMNGKASIWLSRRQFDDKDYRFQVTVTAVRTEMQQPQGGASTGDLGQIIGITVGVVAFLVIAIVVCVCCYRKRRTNEREHTKNEYNKDAVTNSMSSNTSHGYENNMAKISYDDSLKKSPGSDRRLLSKNYSRSDENNGKPKSALERFGHPPSHIRQSNSESRETGSAMMGNSEVIGVVKTGNNLEKIETGKSVNISKQKIIGDSPAEKLSSSKSPFLTAMHNNPKFRKSFHENEVDAEERMRRISDHSSFTSSSANSENLSKKKPKLPPVPKSPPRSPSPQRQGEKIAGIFRARPSSSSSEMAKFEDEESEDYKSLKATNAEKNKSVGRLRETKGKHILNETNEGRKRDKIGKDEKTSRRKHHSQEEEKRQMTDDIETRQRREKIPRSVDGGDDDDDDDRSQRRDRDGEYEGRFKKSASGRKPKGKGQRMGRSKSAGNALEELDSSHRHVHSKSPSSVRSLSLLEDDDDDELDSNYMPFRRSGSKISLYASRSSLYGRRRKNSMGETVSMSSYMYDDVDSRMGDFDKTQLSRKEKERLFKSMGDLDASSASALITRDCATQTGSNKEVYIYGRKTVTKKKTSKRYSQGTQTILGRDRRDSTGSARSGRSARPNRLKHRSKSQESVTKVKMSRSRDFSDEDNISERSSRTRSKRQNKDSSKGRQHRHHSESDLDDDDDYRYKSKQKQNKSREIDTDSDYHKRKQKSKSKSMPKKFLSTASSDTSDSDDDVSAVTSIVAPSSIHQISHQMTHVPQFIPAGYPSVYPQPAIAYVSPAPGGPPIMFPVTSVPQSTITQKPSIDPKPNVSKWDQLVNLTEGMKKRRHQMGESVDSESVLSSTWSRPVTHGSHSQPYYSPSPYMIAHRIPDESSTYGSTYLESLDPKHPPREQHVIGYSSSNYTPNDSNV